MKSLYFDENKVQKECYKLVGISNLGEKSLKGYMKNPKFNKVKNQEGFTITEIAFLQRVAWCLEVDREQTRKILDCLFKGMPFQKRNAFTPKPLCTAKEMDGINISVFEFYDFCIKLHKYIPHLKRPMVEDAIWKPLAGESVISSPIGTGYDFGCRIRCDLCDFRNMGRDCEPCFSCNEIMRRRMMMQKQIRIIEERGV